MRRNYKLKLKAGNFYKFTTPERYGECIFVQSIPEDFLGPGAYCVQESTNLGELQFLDIIGMDHFYDSKKLIDCTEEDFYIHSKLSRA